jgi:uncharacterized protein (TIGR02145 family)
MYYVRAYATNSAGTAYGSDLSFTTLPPSGSITVTDVEGNVYSTVTIGTQVWMAENLKTTKYRNGDVIANVTVDASWKTLTTGAYCNYNNDSSNATTYGRLYNWYAVEDNRDIAPIGWHIPTNAEWTILTDFLGGEDFAGGKLKEAGTLHWITPNTGADNSSGFTAISGGCRENGAFIGIGSTNYFWTSTGYNTSSAWFRGLYNHLRVVSCGIYNKSNGFSVRCIKD